jgi:hypothetical protein
MTNDIAKALEKFTACDLRNAKRHGSTLIGQTKRGTLALTHDAGTYVLTTTGLDAVVLASGKPAAVRPVLASLYEIVEG